MRTIFTLMMMIGLMSTVGVYAAGLGGSPTIKTVGGTGTVSVAAPTDSTITLDWNFTGSQITGVDVTWTPNATGTYDITVDAGGTLGTLSAVAGSSAVQQTATVPMAATEVDAVSDSKVTITQQ